MKFRPHPRKNLGGARKIFPGRAILCKLGQSYNFPGNCVYVFYMNSKKQFSVNFIFKLIEIIAKRAKFFGRKIIRINYSRKCFPAETPKLSKIVQKLSPPTVGPERQKSVIQLRTMVPLITRSRVFSLYWPHYGANRGKIPAFMN